MKISSDAAVSGWSKCQSMNTPSLKVLSLITLFFIFLCIVISLFWSLPSITFTDTATEWGWWHIHNYNNKPSHGISMLLPSTARHVHNSLFFSPKHFSWNYIYFDNLNSVTHYLWGDCLDLKFKIFIFDGSHQNNFYFKTSNVIL